MLFYSFFKSLVGKDVVVELKNDLSICGTLHSVDQVWSRGILGRVIVMISEMFGMTVQLSVKRWSRMMMLKITVVGKRSRRPV